MSTQGVPASRQRPGRARDRERLFLLNDPHALRISPDLAAEIGLNESIVLLQIEYLVSISGPEYERDGHRWTRRSLAELKEDHFPWWDTATISRAIKSLEARRLVLVGSYNRAGFDRTRWLAIDPVGVARLRSVAILQNAKCISANCKMDLANCADGCAQLATTIEKTEEETEEEKYALPVVPPTGDPSEGVAHVAGSDPGLPERSEGVGTPGGVDQVFEVLVQVLGLDPGEFTRSGRESVRAAARQIAEVGATPAEVGRRAGAFRREYPKATLTAAALARHWAALGRSLRRVSNPIVALPGQARPDLDAYHPLNNARGRFLDLSPEEEAQLERGIGAAKGGGS